MDAILNKGETNIKINPETNKKEIHINIKDIILKIKEISLTKDDFTKFITNLITSKKK